MTYRLILTETFDEKPRDIGENVYLDNLPDDYKVYALYYPGISPNQVLEDKLRLLGDISGKNLFVNIGRRNDPSFSKIINRFEIRDYPVIIVTGIKELASLKIENDKLLTAYIKNYVKLDKKKLYDSVELIIRCIERQSNLFLDGKIAEAVKQTTKFEREATFSRLKAVLSNKLEGINEFFSRRDIAISWSLTGGALELKQNAGLSRE